MGDNHLSVIFDFNPINRNQKHYKVGFNFNINDNTFYVDFYNKDYSKIEEIVPLHLIDRLKALLNNIPNYQIYKNCSKCEQYNCSSNNFLLDLKSMSIGSLNLHSEYFGVIESVADGYFMYRLHNHYFDNKSFLYYKKSNNINNEKVLKTNWMNSHIITTELIHISESTDIASKLNKIVVFS